MANLNKVHLIGNLTRDPEVKFTPKGTAVGDFGIAVNRRVKDASDNWTDEVTFIDITTWGKQAEYAEKYLGKGSPVFIEGRLQLDTWEDKSSGQKRSKLKVVAESVQGLERRQSDGQQDQHSQRNRMGGRDVSASEAMRKMHGGEKRTTRDNSAVEPDDCDEIPFALKPAIFQP